MPPVNKRKSSIKLFPLFTNKSPKTSTFSTAIPVQNKAFKIVITKPVFVVCFVFFIFNPRLVKGCFFSGHKVFANASILEYDVHIVTFVVIYARKLFVNFFVVVVINCILYVLYTCQNVVERLL